MRRRTGWREKLGSVGAFLIVGGSIALFVYPVAQFALVSLAPTRYMFGNLWPPVFTLDGYRRLLESDVFTKPLVNSLITVTVAVAIVIIVSVLAAYALTRFRFAKREQVAFFILSLYIFPPVVTIIPVWKMAQSWMLADTHLFLAVAYAYFSLPLSVWLLRSYFQGVPEEIEEAALIDGCSRLGVLRRILMPLSVSGVAVAAVFAFIFSWNEFLFAVVLTETNARTLPVALAAQVSYFTDWGRLSTMTSLSIIPPLVLGSAIQRYIVEGLTLGAVKE